MPAAPISRVYVASNLTLNLPSMLRKALQDAGFGDTIAVEELKIEGPIRQVVLPEETLNKVRDIQFLMADPDIIFQIFDHPMSNLVWAQSCSAGIDFFYNALEKSQKKPSFTLTRHFSGFGEQMSEYLLGQIISRERRFGFVYDQQKEKKYNFFGRCCRAMGMTVWAAVRDDRYSNAQHKKELQNADHIRPMSRLGEMLQSCDYVVSILPSVPGTRNLLSGDVLKPCQNKVSCSFYDILLHYKSVLINVGRGDVIDDDSLINALRNGWLGGAILDVFNTEPLPPTSELWTLPGVTITPHYAATTVSGKTQPADSFIHNFKCYLEGKPMRCVVDFNKGY